MQSTIDHRLHLYINEKGPRRSTFRTLQLDGTRHYNGSSTTDTHEYTKITIKHKVYSQSRTILLQTNKRAFFAFPKTTNSCPYDRGPHHRHIAHTIGLLDLERLDRPVFLRVVQDGPIRAELAHLGTSDDTLLQPRALIQVRLIDQLESVDVGLEVFRKEVVIVVTNGVQQSK